ncbi:leucine-rich repeat domain-containing protein [Flavobacterium sp. FlaQc-48]|uniref:leucine-rich repeat domain-containing protein n=1 Tax=Flavobacterium sp. FlaQc-48 TaxID=3374181 RepID=UPI003757FBE0
MNKKLLIGMLFLFSSLSLFAVNTNVNIPVPDLEYQALVDFYKATGESNWTNKWNTKENNLHEVAWYGVTVENGHVTAINLNNTSNITGAIPASFGNLKFLKTLSIYGGSYAKDLSTTDLGIFSELEALESLDLRYCKLKGIIPASWGKLKKLKTLNLSNNAITGLSPEFGQLESLVTAELSENQIPVLIKELENLTALRTLNLNYNKISSIVGLLPGVVNLSLYYQAVNIENLTYKGTDLKIDNLPNMVTYNRTKNDFSAKRQFSVYVRGTEAGTNVTMAADGSLTIPSAYLSTLKNGDEIYLYQQYDSSTGSVSYYSRIYFTSVKVNQPAVSNIEYQALVDFYNAMGGSNWNNKWDINENNLNEGAWTGLSIENGHVTGLNLNNTSSVSGAIPASFGNLKYLRNLSLYAGSYSKNLSTTDLNVLSELQSLETLDMRYCRIASAIPSSWSKLKKLKTISLYNNSITGLPEELGEMESLVTLDAPYNQIKTIPASIGNLANLETLNLSDNQVEVLIKELENITTLKNLNLSNNNISNIAALLSSSVNLQLYYQNMNIEGLVYTGADVKVQNLPNTVYYNRTKNDFSARRPFGVYVGGNQTGNNVTAEADGSITIPASYLASIKTGDQFYLYQQYDSSTGSVSYYSKVNFVNVKVDQPKIPEEEYQALVDFYNAMGGINWNNKWNVATNNLHEGAWYGVSIENGHITGLNLNNNYYVSGAIPASVSNLKYLKNLSLYGGGYNKDLSTTNLNVIAELESLESLDLRYTKIKGDIPASWSKLKKLKTVYIGYNALTALPEDMGALESLVTFEAPNNQIKAIPVSTGNLTNLVTLNLSDNKITVLIKELENIAALRTLNLANNSIADIAGLLNSQVNLALHYQSINVEGLVYTGADVKIQTLPNTVYYNRTKNDFSARRPFGIYVGGNQIGSNITAAADGSVIIPASSLASIKTGDQFYLYQQYDSSTGSVTYYSTVNFVNVKVDQPKIPDEEYQALVDFYTVMNGTNWNNKWDVTTNNLHEGAWYGVSIENGHITGLNLNNNYAVSGAIPASVKDLKYLKNLSLYGGGYNKDLSTTDLSVLSELESLEYLDLRYTRIKGDLPASWNKLKKLNTLYLNNNALTALPEDFGGMESLVTVNVASNQIKAIPASTGDLSKLVTLNLSSNQIEILIKDLEKNTALQTLNLSGNKVSTIQGLLSSQVSLELTSQTLSIPNFLYEGNDVKVSNLPNVVLYNKATNDFSAQRPFRLYVKGNQVGNNLRVAGDGTITIPADYLSTLKTGDELYLYQDYESANSTSYDSRIYFTNVKVDQPKIPDAEYQALVDFYNAMNGTNWSNKWVTAENNLHEGAWYGVSIQNGHITGLNLNNNSNVSGTIPASFAHLKYLKNLSLYGGSYSKNLSTTDLGIISGLESLESLDLRYTKLKGSVPSSWSKLQALKTLYLNSNTIDDADEALTHLPLLKTVDFSNQTITIPTIEVGANELVINLPTLSTFLFNANGGVINNKNHFTLFINGVNKASNYSNSEGKLIFKDIALFGIKLTDQIRIVQNDGTAQGTSINYTQVVFGKPLTDEEFEILKKFYASTNGAQWTQKWDISQNKLHEVSWYGVGTKDGHVVSLSLSGNNLSGTLPAELSDLAYLETLNLQLNAIEGSIPSDLGRLTKLKTLTLQSNKFQGTLPVLSGISGLKKVSVAGNTFKGTIPGHLNDFENIEQIDLSNNGFEALEKPFTYDLAKVYVNLRGQVIVKNEYLYLKGDEIVVDLPAITTYNETQQDYSGQYQFELQANNFKISEATVAGNTITFPNISVASIPTGAKIAIWQKNGTSQGTYLQFKGIADGSETPLIAEEYDALVAFFQNAGGTGWKEVWDTSSNNLHEKKWKGVTTNDGHVVSINLPDNSLTGNISAEIGKFTELQNLNLAKNKLTGAIPESLSKVTKLKTADLSENELKGIEAAFLPAVTFKIDRQKINLGELPLNLNTVLKDQKINHYDHTNSVFNATQSYNMTMKDYFQMVTVPEDGIKLTNILSEWNVPNNQTLELRQIAGSARNSVLTYTITYREGDSNLDGIVNILDIQSSLNYTLSQKPKFFNYGAADINKDKNLNVLDIILLINKIQAGTLENSASTKRQALAGNEEVVLSIEDHILYIDNQLASTAAFDIRLKDGNKAEIKELLSPIGYTVSVAERDGEISIAGFAMNQSLSGKQAIAKVSPQTKIVSAMISNADAHELTYALSKGSLGLDDIETNTAIALLNYPNPFTDKTVIQYHLSESAGKATLKIFDTAGRTVYTQSDLDTSAGNHEFTFQRKDLASGIYFYTIEVQNGAKPAVFKGKMLIQ